MKIATAVRSAMAQALLSAFAEGTTNLPKIEVYDGTIPDNIGDAFADTLLCSFELDLAVGTESGGVITFGPIQPDVSPPASGTAAWARLLDRDGAEKAYMTVSAVPGSDITLSTTAIVAGEPVSLTSGIVAVGA